MLKGTDSYFLIVDVASILLHLRLLSDEKVVKSPDTFPLETIGAVGVCNFVVMV